MSLRRRRSESRRWTAGGGRLSAGLLLLPTAVWALGFTTGPSVRVDPNVELEFAWITDVAWLGKVEIFDNPDGTGTDDGPELLLDTSLLISAFGQGRDGAVYGVTRDSPSIYQLVPAPG